MASAAWPSARPMLTTQIAIALAGRGCETSSSNGMTARSWNSRMAKLVRPVCEPRRFASDSSCTTMAVDDSDRAAPAISAARVSKPEQGGSLRRWREGRPAPASRQGRRPGGAWCSGARRTVRGRSGRAGRRRPVRRTGREFSESAMTSALKQRNVVRRCGPRISGLSRMPTSRKARTALTPMRRNSGTTRPATPRMIRNSL